MAQPIYKSFFVKFKEPWFQLSQAEQNALLAKVAGTLDTVGGKSQAVCNCTWSNEAWHAFGLEIYPSVEAVQEHDKLLQELNWFRYVESMTALGTEFPMPQ